jgi:hypothetical protein
MSQAVAELIQHQLLPRVSKPNRYLGNALHAPRKPIEGRREALLDVDPLETRRLLDSEVSFILFPQAMIPRM